MIGYVDTHCHVDAYPNPPGVLAEAARGGIVTIAVTELPSAFKRLSVLLGNRALTRLAIGLHPLRAEAATSRERHLFVRELNTTDYIGEVGLDFSRDHPRRRTQLDLFEWVLAQPIEGKIMSLHSRGAEQQLIDMLKLRRLKGPVLHWYSGPRTHVDDALSAGCYFSVNQPMLRSKKGQAFLATVPLERILTETDGPYAKNGRYPSRPTDIPNVVEALARVWGLTPAEAREIVWGNMAKLHATATKGEGI